ncbi:MAG: SMC-Scp complex subunit ScpB [Thermoplasmatota archaeon]
MSDMAEPVLEDTSPGAGESEPDADAPETRASAPIPPVPTPSPTADPVRIVEAALFSGGKPLDVTEIAENTGLAARVVTSALHALEKEYAARDGALEVGQAGAKWAMQVKAMYAPSTVRLAPMEIAPKLLKTLALIAYHQPLLQSDLVDMVGDKAYEHVRELVERGLVKKRLHERSFLLSTTDAFPEYFGIPATDRDAIRRYLAAKVGIPPEALDRAKKAIQEQLPSESVSDPPSPADPPSGEKDASEPGEASDSSDAGGSTDRESASDSHGGNSGEPVMPSTAGSEAADSTRSE